MTLNLRETLKTSIYSLKHTKNTKIHVFLNTLKNQICMLVSMASFIICIFCIYSILYIYIYIYIVEGHTEKN